MFTRTTRLCSGSAQQCKGIEHLLGYRRLCKLCYVCKYREKFTLIHKALVLVACFRHTISIGTVIANNYITFASGASLTGAGLSNAGVTLSAATIVNPRVSANYTSTQTQTITQSVSQTTTSTQSQTVTQILYVTSVNMLSATNFVLLGATDLRNTVSLRATKSFWS